MTVLEVLLLIAVAALALQMILLQRHYDEKFADQAAVLYYLIERFATKPERSEHLDDVRDKLFNSSQ